MYPNLVVRYVSSENFLNDFIDSIRRKRPDDFKHRYRGVDILLLTTSNSSRARSRYSKSSSTPSTRSMSPASRWSSARPPSPQPLLTRGSTAQPVRMGSPHRHPASGCGNPSRHPEEKRRIRLCDPFHSRYSSTSQCWSRTTSGSWKGPDQSHRGSALNRRDIDLETAERVLRDIVTNGVGPASGRTRSSGQPPPRTASPSKTC